jgi:hypothetical protein
MASWLYRGLRRGIVTTRYPRGAPDPWTSTLPTPPAFRSSRLTDHLARRLAAECPAGALSVEGDRLVIDLGRCTGCGRCVEVGGGAVSASGEFELATADRTSLIKRVAIGAGDGDVTG